MLYRDSDGYTYNDEKPWRVVHIAKDAKTDKETYKFHWKTYKTYADACQALAMLNSKYPPRVSYSKDKRFSDTIWYFDIEKYPIEKRLNIKTVYKLSK